MKTKWYLFALFFALCVLAGVPFAQTADRADLKSIMKSCDKNDDHRIDRGEYQHQMTETFFFLDKNKDGHLVTDEIQTQVRGVDPKKITVADRDNNGKLSVYEFCNALHKDFEGADLNDDGTLDIGELEVLMKETEGK